MRGRAVGPSVADMSTTTVVLSDLHHEVCGTGPPVVFIPRASGDAGHFARAAEELRPILRELV